MIKDFVPNQESLALKELGFDEPCFAWYSDKNIRISGMDGCVVNKPIKNSFFTDEIVTAPTFSQAFRFFRENYPELDFGVAKIYNGTNNYHYHINLQWEFFEGTYEEAELECLRKLISIVKQKQNG